VTPVGGRSEQERFAEWPSPAEMRELGNSPWMDALTSRPPVVHLGSTTGAGTVHASAKGTLRKEVHSNRS
jgi:hypothetical protein